MPPTEATLQRAFGEALPLNDSKSYLIGYPIAGRLGNVFPRKKQGCVLNA